MARRGGVTGSSSRRQRQFHVNVRLQETGERFAVSGFSLLTKVAELKEKLELMAGIPIHLQRLSYIDAGDMPDISTFQFNGIVAGVTICMNIWLYEDMSDLVKAAAEGNLVKLIRLGVTKDSPYSTENSSHFNLSQRCEWLAARSSVALYIAAHRGHLKIVQFLLQDGTNVLAKTPLGNSPLHAASSMGKCDCIDVLLANGAQTQDVNGQGHTALDLARLCAQKKVERRLFLFQWSERAATVSVTAHLDPSELFAHQKFDSKLKTWMNGSHGKRYNANLVQHKSFHGSDFSAPKKAQATKTNSCENKNLKA
ncbi:ankyrin repeat domain-containing protein 60 [Pseudophryne corroboree]|uniref:ankyrin repeat domain-containing protein 60 n=1 Tax=Pseudophryne corroboree TaxID=495146 RepID=UPI00308120C7